MKPALLILAFVAAANACRFPSDLWCSSEEIAKECKVYEQCKESEWTVDRKAHPVSMELYYETLCPFCQWFITGQLNPVYANLSDIMNVTLVPYGRAEETKIGDKWVFQCQHGEEECIGNVFETCAIHTLGGDMKKILPFFACIEANTHPLTVAKTCAKKHNVDLDAILSCSNSSLGNQLEHDMGLKTEALDPKLRHVPWIVVNGVYSDKQNLKALKNLLKVICKTYKGPKPAACKKAEEKKPVCVKE